MIRKQELRCSFCGRSENDVTKLVAGMHAYICDRCATRALELMEEHPQGSVEFPAGKPLPEA